jgi:hypothetical protein
VISVLTVCDRPSPGGEPLYSIGSFIGWQQAAPGNVSRHGSSIGRRIPAARNRRDGQNIAAGYSQPPAATFCGPTARWYEYRVVVWSRDKAAPLQTLGTNTPRQRSAPFEDDDEDDYEGESYCINPDPRLIASAKMTVLNRNESIAWTNDMCRIRLDVIETSDT